MGISDQNNLAEVADGLPPTIMDQYDPAGGPNQADIDAALASPSNVRGCGCE